DTSYGRKAIRWMARRSSPTRGTPLSAGRRLLYHVNYRMKDLLESLHPGDPDWKLAAAIDPDRLPAHIAIIMDGNGRWARSRSLPRAAGHTAGIESVRSTVETCRRLGINALTLYSFSTENW